MSESNHPPYPCSECQAGQMRLKHISYFTWLSEELITVPNFPAWVCDLCGRREYDERAIVWLSAFLSPNAGRSALGRTRRPAPLEKKRRPSRPTTTE